jgi:hypothetical protein
MENVDPQGRSRFVIEWFVYRQGHVNVPKYDKRGRRIPREGNPVMVQIEGIACSHRKEGAALYEQARSHEGMAEHAIYAWAGRVPWVRDKKWRQRREALRP